MQQKKQVRKLSATDLEIASLLKSFTKPTSTEPVRSVRPERLIRLKLHKFGVPKAPSEPVLHHRWREARLEEAEHGSV